MRDRLWFFLAMLLVAFQVLIALPVAVWLHNEFNFSAAFTDSKLLFGVLFAGISCLLLLLAMCTPAKIRKLFFPLFVFTSILIYIQQYLTVWDYGVLDGRPIDFSRNRYLGILDLCLWAGGALIFIALRKQISAHAKTILIFPALLTTVALITTVMTHDFASERSTGSIDEADKFTFSGDENIFLFVLDGFQSDMFWEIIDQHPEIKQELNGFTFYANTTGVFAKTYPTIPLLLTGEKYQKEQPFRDFLEKAYQNSLLTELKNEGWDVGLYPYVKRTVALDTAIMSNYRDRTTWPEKIDNYLQALDIALFQSVPHSLKRHVYNDGSFVTGEQLAPYLHEFDHLFDTGSVTYLPTPLPHPSLNFRDNLRMLGAVGSGMPTFRFYHMFMPHEPFTLNADLEFGQLGRDFPAYREYALASVRLMMVYLQELKRLGVYDNSSIIIAADHGAGEITHEKYVSHKRSYVPVFENGGAMASGKPLLLVKMQSDNSVFEISQKPVSLTDVAPTIASVAGIRLRNTGGIPVDEVTPNEQRERTYFHYNFSGWDSKFLNDFHVYKIDGNVYDDDAWAHTGLLTAREEVINRTNYTPGATIRFGSDIKTDADYMNAFLVGDHYGKNASYVISNNGWISFSIPLDSPVQGHESLYLESSLSTTGQTLNVLLDLDQQTVDSYAVSKDRYKVHILDPQNLKQNDRLNLDFHLPDQDTSSGRLMISMLKLQKVSLAEMTNHSEIHFSGNLDRYLPEGLWQEEDWGRWTSETESSLHFVATPGFCKNHYLLLRINRFYTGVDPDGLEAFINNQQLQRKNNEAVPGGKHYYFDCSEFNGELTGVTKLTFKTDKVLTPVSMGTNNDERALGVALISLKLVDKETLGTSEVNSEQ